MRNKALFALMTAAAGLASLATEAQTMNIYTGNIITAVTASEDEIAISSDGTELTVEGKTFSISDIDSIYIDDSSFDDNNIKVVYSGDEATVTIAGNIAKYMTTIIDGAHVSMVQSEDVEEELTYTLEGSSDDGSFWMDGELKCSIVLNGLTLTCADSAAINIRDGKRISVELVEGTTNTLVDGEDGSQKGCFIVNGHAEFKGAGDLYITGNTKHAFFGDEYVELKKSTGNITVLSAVKDGFNINQYLEVKGGTLTISNVGDDGIQVSVTDDDTDEQNGQVIISGGEINVDVTATAAKGLKCDSTLTISGGTITISTSGGGEYDSDEKDVTGSAAIKADGDIVISDGTLTLTSTGKGGKGISADGDITIDGGTITATTTGGAYTYGQYDTNAKGIKSDADLTINGGEITVSCTGGDGSEGIESKATLTITDGTIIIDTYDDAINASTCIDISGGQIYACSTNNDAIDSNGKLYISGGLVLASGTTSPEGPFDCDDDTFGITGGTIIGVGGDSSDPTSSACTQPVLILMSVTFSKGSYIALSNSEDSVLFTFMIPQKYSSSSELFVSCPEMTIGETFTITTDVTVSDTGNEWQGYSEDATVSGGSGIAATLTSYVTTTTGTSTGGGIGGGSTGGNTPGGNTGGGNTGGGNIGGGSMGGF